MEEKQIEVVIFIVDRDSPLASHETEIRAQYQQEVLQVAQDRGFKVLLAVSVPQSEKVQEVGIAEGQIRARVILVAQGIELLAGQVVGFPADRNSPRIRPIGPSTHARICSRFRVVSTLERFQSGTGGV